MMSLFMPTTTCKSSPPFSIEFLPFKTSFFPYAEYYHRTSSTYLLLLSNHTDLDEMKFIEIFLL